MTPLSTPLGFSPLPWQFYGALAVFIVLYLMIVEATKTVFYADRFTAAARRHREHHHRISRRAARFNHVKTPAA
jgi:Mg2+-importing ATPase